MKWVCVRTCTQIGSDEKALQQRKMGFYECRVKHVSQLHPDEKAMISTVQRDASHQRSSGNLNGSIPDLSKQLHACTRTNKVALAASLLHRGANVNFQDERRGNTTPLHIAAQNGQKLQVELLFANGADPWSKDDNGKTPVDIALENGQIEIARRLREHQYLFSDTLTKYVDEEAFGNINHERDVHFILRDDHKPKDNFSALDAAQFANICEDIFDEVNRRELNTFVVNHSFKLAQPVGCTNYSEVRNKFRLQLTKLPVNCFKALCKDILFSLSIRMNITCYYLTANEQKSKTKSRPNSKEMELIGSSPTSDDMEFDNVETRSHIEKQVERLQYENMRLAKSLEQVNSEKDKRIEDLEKELDERNKQFDELEQKMASVTISKTKSIDAKGKMVSRAMAEFIKVLNTPEFKEENLKSHLRAVSLSIDEFTSSFPKVPEATDLLNKLDDKTQLLLQILNNPETTTQKQEVWPIIHSMATTVKQLVTINVERGKNDVSPPLYG